MGGTEIEHFHKAIEGKLNPLLARILLHPLKFNYVQQRERIMRNTRQNVILCNQHATQGKNILKPSF